jgi:fumarylacetoacetate (FAA) hydrolase
MKLVSFVAADARQQRVGAIDGDFVREFAAESMIDWLCGRGRTPTGTQFELASVQLLAPVPEPPAYRDFMTYEGHVTRAMHHMFDSPGYEMPEYWYEKPVFYFSNPAAIVGPDAVVKRPAGVGWLDFELEIAAIVDGDGAIAGFAILNDWSARDVQLREATVSTGVHKSKDFATSLGPWLVTPDELPYAGGRLSVTARVEVNGDLITETSTELQRFTFTEMLAAAAQDTRLRAGDVLGSGTLDRGCFAELGSPSELRWLQPGDEVVVTVDGLGQLRNVIG